ncbi:DUF1427 family protein [Pseudomonas sp. BN102]|uniref:DUF1427 family protein n=1 Tax=Pseudomonas sp. BN102 TaxID=2567886 RepID=UPI002456826C|nr:DUF1427 family protein [Pseudomonas sp. BN102]MDH4611574.1 DUF1427 family protein [Pseudomonas sp. BN102]
MKIYLLSLATGVLVGSIYAVLGVRSPAPPIIALVGLLGILLGEQLVPFAKRIGAGHSPSDAGHSMEWMPSVGGVSQEQPPKEGPSASGKDANSSS